MTRRRLVARRAEELLGAQVISTAPAAGGDVSTATRLRLNDGRTVLMKSLPAAPEGFYASEARGLRWLAETATVAVGEVLAGDRECLLLTWIETTRPSMETASEFGRDLARLHRCRADTFGLDEDGWIGRLPLPNRPCDSWPEFYATRRLLPYLKLARDRGQISDEDAAAVEAVVGRLTDLLPPEPAARVHGDLWNGNCLWGLDGRVHVIDPAAHGGHRELDLAMLALFGLPHLARVMSAYQVEHPLAEGWEDRLGVHQLFPLLVHAVMFGGSYGARAGDIATRYL